MTMTQRQARRKLKKLAADKYHVLEMQWTTFHDKKKGTEYGVYINGFGWHHSRKTWEDAFASLEKCISYSRG